ncbi:ATP-binding protein [Massilia terrae]|uniref:SpoIIE family protein phosphatase n=1 Tax=Massilia terrae TaxID=1811224 RepID=A0ABT2CRH0_9BURK|nr:SpoIIE family protein phosphatase [Massilia terrae]MCS0656562.1 SpoIIE family protein phosphatase [Massilia terrae]
MEALISSLSRQQSVAIDHASDVAAARRAGIKLAGVLGFDETRTGQLAIIITEAATNIIKHAGHGMLYIGPAQSGAAPGIDVVALDSGPGIADFASSLVDGVSTAGTAGTGLGALHRLSDEIDVYSQRGKGAAFFMRLWRDTPAPAPRPVVVGALALPIPGEEECGDGWAFGCHEHGATLLAADGLGHGPEAARAADAAIETFGRERGLQPAALMQRVHEALRITRGAAVALAYVDCGRDEVRFAGLGNISAWVVHDGRRALVSHNGIVGHNMRKVQEFSAAFPPGALCIMHSDGLQTQWDLDAYPGLAARHPSLVAAILMRDFSRRRDDAMVLAVRRRERA